MPLPVSVGGQSLSLPRDVGQQRPALAGSAGRDVVLGVRSEDMEDAIIAGGDVVGNRRRAKVTLVEALGSEIMVHFAVNAPKPRTADIALLAKEQGADEVPHDETSRWIASFAARSRVRVGDEIQVVVDIERMHWFDPESGLSIRS